MYGLISGDGRVPNGAEYLLFDGIGSTSLSSWSYNDSMSQILAALVRIMNKTVLLATLTTVLFSIAALQTADEIKTQMLVLPV